METIMQKMRRLTRTDKVILALTGVFYTVWGYYLAMAFYRQSVEYNGKYFSDIPAHIASGMANDTYSIMGRTLAMILKVTGNYKLIGIFLAVLALLTILVTWVLMCYLFPEGDPVILHVFAILCNIVTAIYLPMFNKYRYLGVQSGNIYHNPTYTGMKLFAMAALFFYVKNHLTYDKKMPVGDWILFAVSLIFANLIKPNFYVAFTPAMGIYLLIDLFEHKGKTFPKIFLFGLAVIPAALTLIYQYTSLYPSDGSGGGIVIDIGYSIMRRCAVPWLAVIQTMALPFWILLFNLKDLKEDRTYQFSWVMLLVSFLQYIVFCESGARKNDGNWSWGYCFVIYFIFVVSIVKIYKNFKEGFRPKWYYIAAAGLGSWHLACGIRYFLILLSGNGYV